MSIHTRTPTESQSNTDPRPTSEPTETGDAADGGPTTDEPATDEPADSWVERCQQSFSTTDTRRLRNLTDGANESMPNPE